MNIRPKTIKLLEEDIGSKFLDTGLGDDFFEFDIRLKCKGSKNKQLGLPQTKKLLHSEGHHQQNEKATDWMRENVWKSYNWSD